MDSGKLMKKLQDAGWQIRGGKKQWRQPYHHDPARST